MKIKGFLHQKDTALLMKAVGRASIPAHILAGTMREAQGASANRHHPNPVTSIPTHTVAAAVVAVNLVLTEYRPLF